MKTPNITRVVLGVGLLLGANMAVRADDTVTFQVDMSRYTNATGAQAATLVDVRGAFPSPLPSWSSGMTLVNNGANVYTNTFTVPGNAGDKIQYKFTFSTCAGTTWEDNNPPPGAGQPPDEGNNRILQLVGGAQTLPVVPLYAPGVVSPMPNLVTANITYRVDMTAQIDLGTFIPGFYTIRVTGNPAALTGWGDGIDLTNNPALPDNTSNIYSAVIALCGTPGGSGGAFKFRNNGGWEDTSDGLDRNFTFTGSDQVLPVYYYSDQPPGVTTNANVTFQVDMTPQVLTGGFTNGVGTVGVSGNITGGSWPEVQMTNDPSATGNASNIYYTTISVYPTTVGMWSRYKFRMNGGWETAAIYGVGNNKDRRFYYTGGDQTLPLVTYSDASLCDLLTEDVTVTFLLHITNGTPDMNGNPFDSANDTIYLNGDFINWNAPTYWTTSLPQMTNNPVGSDFYQQSVVIARGSGRGPQFKFGLSGPGHPSLDNESAGGANHIAWIRSAGSSYTFPVAEFGNLFAATRVEPQWGNLTVGSPSGGNVPVTWLGCPCVTLQTKTSVSSGAWTDLPTTDAGSSTNWPNTGGQRFFRLQKRPLP